jgi:hypothetical protein
VAEVHKKLAKTKRGAGDTEEGAPQIESEYAMKVEDLSIFGTSGIHPIIFEELYVKDQDAKFVQLVKNNPDLLTEEQILSFQKQEPASFM